NKNFAERVCEMDSAVKRRVELHDGRLTSGADYKKITRVRHRRSARTRRHEQQIDRMFEHYAVGDLDQRSVGKQRGVERRKRTFVKRRKTAEPLAYRRTVIPYRAGETQKLHSSRQLAGS